MTFVFFSSRRRHTRCLSDWSSDVCSSDLERGIGFGIGVDQPILDHQPGTAVALLARLEHEFDGPGEIVAMAVHEVRSEERRVGKECGDRGGEIDYEKK